MKINYTALPAVLLLGLIGLVTLTPSARAGDSFSIGARAMTFMPNDGDTSWNGGLQARFRLPALFAVEASVDHRKYDVGSQTIEDYPVQLSALMFVLPKLLGLQPFILAGGGWYNSKVETPNISDHTDSRFAPHAGAGLDLSLGSKIFLDATYRYVWLDSIQGIDAAGHMVTLGVNYRI